MRAHVLYTQLEKDFVKPGIVENWYDDMTELEEYICDNFKQRSLGLVCDFAEEVNKVYTAVFPSDKVLTKILNDGASNAMLFLHHPSDWDLSRNPEQAFYQMNAKLLDKFKESKISIFNFHLPLDNFGEYATTKTLADALSITITKSFAKHNGAMCGVIGTTDCKDVHELNAKYTQVVGHQTKLYKYGSDSISNNTVGIVAGGGNDADTVRELIDEGVNVLISGLSMKNSYSQEAHELEEKHKINLLGGTHYSSEKFACIAVCKYFEKLGLPAEFIPDTPCLEDL